MPDTDRVPFPGATCNGPATDCVRPLSRGLRRATFTAYGHFPGLNEVNNANRTHWSMGAEQKKWADSVMREAIIAAKLPAFTGPVRLTLVWTARDRRRDPDNVASAVKYVCDALVGCKVLPNDSWAHVKGITHEFDVDKSFPRVTVTIEAVS